MDRHDISTLSAAAVLLAAVCLLPGTRAHAQELEPRAYSPAPIGTNFLVAGYTRTTGGVSLVPSIPVTGVEASINTGLLGYDRTFGLAGRTASAGVLLPYVNGDLSGQVGEQGRQISRSGLGDLALRFTANLYGDPALTPAEFARREPTTTIGAALTIVAPTGDYNPQHLINIGANRWAFKPEIGLEQPIGNWFVNAVSAVWLFGDNTSFVGDNVRSQNPLWNFELDAGYVFRPGLWLAASGTWYTGGETSLNGVADGDSLANSRYGLTLSVPVAQGLSAKVAWSSWLTGRFGGQFNTIGFTLQYRWFDR
ncbi:MAG: transporter [Stellaceae bacterium]